MLTFLKTRSRQIGSFLTLPARARREALHDLRGLAAVDPGIDRVIEEGSAWLGRAQDHSLSQDGGVARHFSLVSGWGPSYPETTGYIVPTMLAYADRRGGVAGEQARQRARRMLDWLVSIQFPEGGFQGGTIGESLAVPVTFNTGQILIGLASGVRAFGDAYREPMRRAALWLVETQDPDGCWRRFPSPRVKPGEKVYETHVAWGLLEAARVEREGGGRSADAALANVRWALSHQRPNGWFARCCLTDESRPITHGIGYTLRGIVEAYLFTGDRQFLEAAKKTADGLLTAIRADGFLPGRLDSDWQGRAQWACLAGTVQIAACWFLLAEETGQPAYREAARAANRYVRRTIKVEGQPEIRGAVKGAFPVHGAYCSCEYPNWSCKFTLDSNLLERAASAERGSM
jgi:hypothetical protein